MLPSKLTCKVIGCIEKHGRHHCKNCNDSDSNHFSRNCFKLPRQSCKVAGCKENHSTHFCRLCGDTNSYHFAMYCPQSQELYHATHLQNLMMDDGIGDVGLKPLNHSCRFGEGIYFCEKKFAEELSESFKGVLLKCRVYLGNCKDYGNSTDAAGSWRNTHDSCKAIHPPWRNDVTSSEFTEFVIKNSKKCKVYSITYKGKEFWMSEYQKDKEIIEKIQNGTI